MWLSTFFIVLQWGSEHGLISPFWVACSRLWHLCAWRSSTNCCWISFRFSGSAAPGWPGWAAGWFGCPGWPACPVYNMKLYKHYVIIHWTTETLTTHQTTLWWPVPGGGIPGPMSGEGRYTYPPGIPTPPSLVYLLLACPYEIFKCTKCVKFLFVLVLLDFRKRTKKRFRKSIGNFLRYEFFCI